MKPNTVLITLQLLFLAGISLQWAGARSFAPEPNPAETIDLPALKTQTFNSNTLGCSILLVDKDFDFTSQIGGGLPYYTTALDALGIPFTVWDSLSQGDPTSTDLDPYQVVIWFSGYNNLDPLTFADETLLADYLQAGGSLWLSSLDYYYTASYTWFMQSYLGVASIQCDRAELDPVGVNGNPIGDGLGTYSLARPDQWESYWPTGDDEGPFDDYVTALAGVGVPFQYAASGMSNSTNYDGQIFRTIFLAWPLEWVPELNDRADILGASLAWLCARNAADLQISQTTSPNPLYTSSVLTYTITVANQGPISAQELLISDRLPPEVDYSSASPGCLHADGVVSCELGVLAAGQSLELSIRVSTPLAPAILVNLVEASSQTFDPDLRNNFSLLGTALIQPLVRWNYLPLMTR
jgi:uncharacterized repeat protein (TIGR01451 family)